MDLKYFTSAADTARYINSQILITLRADLARMETDDRDHYATADRHDMRRRIHDVELVCALIDATLEPKPMRLYSLTLNDSGVETDEYPTNEARQSWFDRQDAIEDDFYFLDVSATGELLAAGIAMTGDALELDLPDAKP